MAELHGFYPPELANRFFDIIGVQKGVSKLLVDFPAALLQILLGLVLLSLYHPFFIIFGILLLLLIYTLFKYSVNKGLVTSLEESRNKYKVAHWLQEVARAVVSFKLSGSTQLALNKNDKLVNSYLKSRESHFKILIFQYSKMIVFKLLVTAGLLIVGGLLVLNQQMNIGQFVAAEIIILLIINSVEKLITGLESFYDVLTSLEKLGQVYDRNLENQDGIRTLDPEQPLEIELKDLTYEVDGLRILNDISLTIKPGEKVLLKGHNGAGKSTMLKLIAGVFQPTHGNVYINNISCAQIPINKYRSLLGLSLSEESPFEGTILENLTFGKEDISEQQIFNVLDVVGLSEFVKKQDKGLETILYPEGKKLSFTISKKIILARALLKTPKLLILREPLEQFDAEEANRIIDYITHKDRPWALIVVSDYPYWAHKIDRVITLQNGNLIS